MKYLTLILCTLFFSSCLEIIEEVDLKDNGSGKLSYTLNLSQSKTKITSLMMLDSINGVQIPSEAEIRSKINEVATLIGQTKGISNLTKVLDFNNYIFKFTCNFTDTDALNNASIIIKENYKIEDPNNNTDDHFTFSNNTFRRKGDYKGQADINRIKEEDLALIEKAQYTGIYRFESEILSVSNADTKISPNRKAAMIKHKVIDLATGNKKIENSINLK